jgi:hypothetical protein
MRKPTAKALKKKAWKLFSQYIRMSAADENGMVECYTCGARGRWQGDRFQAGHVIGGRGNWVLLRERLVKVQCWSCNCGSKRGNYEVFIPKWIKEHSLEEYDYHVLQSRKPHKMTLTDWQDAVLYYEMRIKDEEKRLKE